MLSLVGSGLAWLLSWAAAPFSWFASLPFYDTQLPTIGLVLLVLARKRIGTALVTTVVSVEGRRANAKFYREWNTVAGWSDEDYDRYLAESEELALHLLDEADDFETKAMDNRFRFLPGAADGLLRVADKRRARHSRLRQDIDHYKNIWRKVCEERQRSSGDMAQILPLLTQLNSPNLQEARHALASLNRLGDIDWSAVIPRRLPDPPRGIALKCLRLMSGTSNLQEARNAYGRINQILQGHRIKWEEFAT